MKHYVNRHVVLNGLTAAHMTQNEFANQVGKHPTSISGIINGKQGAPEWFVEASEILLNITPEELFSIGAPHKKEVTDSDEMVWTEDNKDQWIKLFAGEKEEPRKNEPSKMDRLMNEIKSVLLMDDHSRQIRAGICKLLIDSWAEQSEE